MPHDMPQDWNVFPSAGPLGVCALVVLVPLALEKSVSVAVARGDPAGELPGHSQAAQGR
jgi:hypothetical protein